jgi:hypothetical protein
MRRELLILFLTLAIEPAAHAQSMSCPFPEQKPMLVIQLFFGQRVPQGGQITAQQWRSFIEQTLTPHFPEGFTVYDAYGQWQRSDTHVVGREHTKVVMIAAADNPQVRDGIAQVTEEYRKQFHQQSVGVLTSPACGAF